MYVTINSKKYTQIDNLSFIPQIDLSWDSLPVNQFVVDIITDDDIEVTQYANLYDDRGKLWAHYWITYAERINAYTVKIKAESILSRLDKKTMKAVYYNESVVTVLNSIFRGFGGSNGYTIDDEMSVKHIIGFLPEQSAKDRLQQVCFAIGGYVKTWYNSKPRIEKLDDTIVPVSINKTYWKPSITQKDYVTTINLTYYEFAYAAEKPNPDIFEWVEDGNGNYYVISEKRTITYKNPNIPEGLPEYEITIDDIMVINKYNMDEVLTNLVKMYFNRVEVDANIINNRDYAPNNKIILQTDDERTVSGYIESCNFAFGLQSMSRIHLAGVEDVETAKLIIYYKYKNDIIGRDTYMLPIGFEYKIDNPWMDQSTDKHRFVYRPKATYATGTIIKGTNENAQEYDVALHYNYSNNILTAYYATDVESREYDTEKGTEVVVIG